MSNETGAAQPVAVFHTPEFKRGIRQLAKKYRQIKSDVQPLLDMLGQGQTPGDQIPGVQYEVFKARVRNSDSGRGKSGGYRVIYQRKADSAILLITIYSKSDQADVMPGEIRQIILDDEAQQRAATGMNGKAAADSSTESSATAESEDARSDE